MPEAGRVGCAGLSRVSRMICCLRTMTSLISNAANAAAVLAEAFDRLGDCPRVVVVAFGRRLVGFLEPFGRKVQTIKLALTGKQSTSKLSDRFLVLLAVCVLSRLLKRME